MKRQLLYPISKSAYLFRELVVRTGGRKQPEEAVRQWCAYELIRAYGIRIDDLEFERPVRVASRSYRIDIVVLSGGRPWIVVECKKPMHSNARGGMAQAISYADAQGVQAAFAVYTDGEVWHVRRRVHGHWFAVTDLPVQATDKLVHPITDILATFNAVTPLLHQLGERLAGPDAKKFFGAMQVFFNGRHLLTEGINKHLKYGTDNLLRILSANTLDTHYRLSKLSVARDSFESYRKEAGFESELASICGDSITENSQFLYASLILLLEGSPRVGGFDLLLLRLTVALASYGMHQGQHNEPCTVLPQSLQDALRCFLEASFAVHLNTEFPDPLDNILCADMKRYTNTAWKQFQNE